MNKSTVAPFLGGKDLTTMNSNLIIHCLHRSLFWLCLLLPSLFAFAHNNNVVLMGHAPLAEAQTTFTLISSQDSVCFAGTNGRAYVRVLGGMWPYTFEWSNGSTDSIATGLFGGFYTVNVTDASGAFSTTQVEVVQKQQLFLTLAQTLPDCHNGRNGQLTVQNTRYGNQTVSPAQFQYSWNTIPQQFGQTATNLTANTSYEVTISDATGCTAVSREDIDNPRPMDLQPIIKSPSCFDLSDGSIGLQTINGNPPFNYTLNTGQTAQDSFMNLAAATYTILITDSKGCTASGMAIVNQPAKLNAQITVFDVPCFGDFTGMIESSGLGGTPPYQYTWEGNISGRMRNNLSAGSYILTITDNNLCSKTDTISVQSPAAPISSSLNVRNVSCYGDANGRIELQVQGGTAPHTYSMDGINYLGNNFFIGLTEGRYAAYVKDQKGCIQIIPNIIIETPEAITVNVGIDTTLLSGETIELSLKAENTQGNFSVKWSTPESSLLSCTDCPNPQLGPVYYQTTVKAYIKDEAACSGEDTKTFFVKKEDDLLVATGFTPNDDGINDFLFVQGKPGVNIRQFEVFNRKGERVYVIEDFDTNNADFGWDGTFRGKPAPQEVYFWQLIAAFPDGEIRFIKGETSLIR